MVPIDRYQWVREKETDVKLYAGTNIINVPVYGDRFFFKKKDEIDNAALDKLLR